MINNNKYQDYAKEFLFSFVSPITPLIILKFVQYFISLTKPQPGLEPCLG